MLDIDDHPDDFMENFKDCLDEYGATLVDWNGIGQKPSDEYFTEYEGED